MPAPPVTTRLEAACRDLVAAATPPGGTVSVWLAGLQGDPVVTLDAGATHYAASTVKLPVVVAAHRLHDRGVLDLDAPVPVVDRVGLTRDGDQDDATWDRVGGTAPLRWLAEHALVRSGNLAANLVLEAVGPDETAAVLRAAGCSPATAVRRAIGDSAAEAAGTTNTVTASDLGRLLRHVAAHHPEVEEVLGRQEHRGLLLAGLPAGVRAGGKAGWVDGVAHDGVLVRPEGAPPYVLAVCSTTGLPDRDGWGLLARLGAVVHAGWTA